MGAGEEVGLAKVAAALDVIHDRVPDEGVITCLEITAGQGTCLAIGSNIWQRLSKK